LSSEFAILCQSIENWRLFLRHSREGGNLDLFPSPEEGRRLDAPVKPGNDKEGHNSQTL